jgi:3-oxoadipate enol-lactonase
MPELRRAGKPTLHYALDDYTDPWRDAPHLILQHGYGRSGRFWYSWVPYLSRFYKVVRPDLRGLGQSGVPDDLDAGLNVEAYIDDLLAIIDALGNGPVHYCGGCGRSASSRRRC